MDFLNRPSKTATVCQRILILDLVYLFCDLINLNGALLTWILEDFSRLFFWADTQIAAEVRGGGEVLHRELFEKKK